MENDRKDIFKLYIILNIHSLAGHKDVRWDTNTILTTIGFIKNS